MLTERQKSGLDYLRELVRQVGYSLDIETAQGEQLTYLARLYNIERYINETDVDLRKRAKPKQKKVKK